MLICAIGGFRLHSPLLMPAFQVFAVPSFAQSSGAEGNRLTDARFVDGRYFSLSAWDSPAAMRAYAKSGAHARAVRASSWLGSGPFTFFTSLTPPTWEEALEKWRAEHAGALPSLAQSR